MILMLILAVFPTEGRPMNPAAARTFVAALVAGEVMDKREAAHFMTGHDDHRDLRVLADRVRLSHDHPLSDRCKAFPAREVLSELKTLNRQLRWFVDNQSGLTPSRDWREAVRQLDEHYVVLDLACDASCPHYYVWVRRRALHQLRERIGPSDFNAGRLPPIPTWFLEEVP